MMYSPDSQINSRLSTNPTNMKSCFEQPVSTRVNRLNTKNTDPSHVRSHELFSVPHLLLCCCCVLAVMTSLIPNQHLFF